MHLKLANQLKKSRLINQINQKGDTVVEVLVSMSILALVLGTAYASSSHSLETGTAAAQRNEALSYAQSQLEYIVNAQYTDPVKLASYTSTTSPFCTTADGGVFQGSAATSICSNYDNKGYAVFVTYDSAMKVFNVDVKWAGANLASQQSSLKLHYKLPGGFALRPTVSTGVPNSITTSSMTLTGTVNPNGYSVTSCSFSYGTTTAYGSTVACSPSPGAGTTAISVTGNISGLSAGTVYHIRLCATNSAGTTCDTNDVTASTTLSPPPGPAPPPPPPPPGPGPPPPPPSGSPPSCGPVNVVTGTTSASASISCDSGSKSWSGSYNQTDRFGNNCGGGSGGSTLSYPQVAGTVNVSFTVVVTNAFGSTTKSGSGSASAVGGFTC